MLGTAALLFMPHPGSLLLPFSKICQALFDADPFPVKVRFLLFQGSRLHNLTPSAFSCFPLKRKCCYTSVFFFFPSRIFSGTNLEHWLQNLACVGPSLGFKEWKELLKKRYPPTSVSLTQAYTHIHKQAQTDFASCILMLSLWGIRLEGVCWRVLTCDPKSKLSHGASARRLC